MCSSDLLAIAFLVDVCLRVPGGALLGWLSSAPAAAIGRMSYSIYLWQQLFLDRGSTATMCRFPVNLLAVAAMSTLSYFAVERTSLALRQRLEGRIFRRRGALQPAPVPLRVDGL